MESATADSMAKAFISNLDEAKIPWQRYHELYRRAMKMRITRLELGLKCDDFSVDMMIACWPELNREIRQKEIESGRVLPKTAQSDCDLCYGTGMEVVVGQGARRCSCRN